MEEQNEHSGSGSSDHQGSSKVKVDLPEYNEGLGRLFELPDEPKSDFDGVVTEVYPLKADLERLQCFCEHYLNGVVGDKSGAGDKPDGVRFDPVAPWVLLQVCKYGKMAFNQANVGWVFQHELAFGFPVRVTETDARGQPKFNWAMVYPFIYVDNPWSTSLGRQVYGWGKAGMELLAPRPDPEPHTRCLLSIDLTGGPERNATRTAGAPRFLEIFQQASVLSGNTGLASLWTLFPRLLQGSLQTVSGFLGAASALSSGVRNSAGPIDFFAELQKMAAQMFGAYDYLDHFLSAAADMVSDFELMKSTTKYDLGRLNIVTLKQFHDAENTVRGGSRPERAPEEETTQACYRALVMSHIEFRRVLDGGMLRTDLMSPDLTGGIQIKVHESGRDKVVGDLGIKYDYKDGSDYVLRPYSPFWLKSHLSYGVADRQYWRTRETPWSTDDDPRPKPLKNAVSLPYVKMGSGDYQEVPGALTLEDFTYQVFALKGDKGALDQLLDEYLKKPLKDSKYEFELRTARKNSVPDRNYYVLAMFSSNVVTGKDARRKLFDRVVTFALPVRCIWEGKPRRALVPLYSLVEQDWDLATESEIYGQLAFKSLIGGKAPSWIEKSNVKLQVLRSDTLLFPELKKTEPAQVLPFIEVDSFEPVFEVSERQQPRSGKEKEEGPGEEWDHRDRTAFYLELLGLNRSDDRRIRYVALKQIRDAIHFRYVSYQALVGVTTKVGFSLRDFRNEPPIDVLMYSYHDKFDLARNMGLECEETELLVANLNCTRHTTRTLPGIRFQGTKEERIGENLTWSVEKKTWYAKPDEPLFFRAPE